jgi:NAD(P)-dependent dehydrogenase (short-subunit alcohol dehydrogenase family)
MARFAGKTALITGGTTGIGLATAQLLKAEGARVAITGRGGASLAEAKRTLGDDVLAIASDTSKVADVEALAAKVGATFGGLDLVFVNAGIAKFSPLEGANEALFDETFGVNVRGAFFTAQKLAPLVRAGGSIVLNTSVVAQKGLANTSIYSASKAALRSFARTLAAELLPRGVRVNAIAPGPISTPILDKLGLGVEEKAGFEAQMRENNPMKRFGTPDEVARAVLYLAADATYTTGFELLVDGGLSQL